MKRLDYRLLWLSSVASQCAAISPFGFPEGLRPPIGKVNIYSTQKGQHFTDQSATMRIRSPEEDGAAGRGWMTIEQSKDTGKVTLSRRLKNMLFFGEFTQTLTHLRRRISDIVSSERQVS